MPYFNGMGPMGAGPMTGWGMRSCGYGSGRPFGKGKRFTPSTWTKEDEKQHLEDYKKDLEDELADVKAELEKLNEAK